MNKHLILVFLMLGLTSCDTKDESYYLSHPKELQQAIAACPLKQPKGMTCAQIEVLGTKMNQLGYELQSSPPNFGRTILALQETIAKQEVELKKGQANTALTAETEQNKRKLIEYLAVVKWLESPES